MCEYRTIRQAKDYLAGKIADEAQREGSPLTEVERKMLYFSDTGWTLPNMKTVSAEFDRVYDQDEYERKIQGLVRRIENGADAQSEEEKESWYQAVLKLCDGDHYLVMLIDAAKDASPSRWGRLGRWIPSMSRQVRREPGDRMRLIVVAMAVAFAVGVILTLLTWLFGPGWRHFGNTAPAQIG